MHKKTAKSHLLTEKQPGGEFRFARMTVGRRASDDSVHTRFDNSSINCSSRSWDYRIIQSSWLEDIEDVTSYKILENWRLVERTIFNEEDQLPVGILFDECLQWRDQSTHLRILGRSILRFKDEDRTNVFLSNKKNLTARRGDRSAKKKNQESGLLHYEYNYDYPFKDSITRLVNKNNQRQAKDEVLDIIVNFICKELSEIEVEKEVEDLSDNFDEFLKISPAPTYIGKNPLVSNHFYHNIEKTNTLVKKEKNLEQEQEKKHELQIGRNKLGTIFSEKIIVSPVPFISTTRTSFSTLQRTPVPFLGENHNILNNIRSNLKQDNVRQNLSLTMKKPLIARPFIQSWNIPVCPTIWPKNIKLTPIDTARLPSSKRRPTKTAENLPLRHSRNTLSPISCSIQSTFHNYVHNDVYHSSLEICGSHIVTQVSQLESKTARENQACAKLSEEQ